MLPVDDKYLQTLIGPVERAILTKTKLRSSN